MKTSDTKTSTNQLHAKQESQPFFKKEGRGVPKPKAFFNTQSSFFHSTGTSNNHGIQAKLSVGQPNDKYEKEADSKAKEVVQRLDTSYEEKEMVSDDKVQSKEEDVIQQKPIFESSDTTPDIQNKCEACSSEGLKESEKAPEQVNKSAEIIQSKPIFESEASSDSEIQTKAEGEISSEPVVQLQSEEELQREELGDQEQESVQRQPIFESETDSEVNGTSTTEGEEDSSVHKKENDDQLMAKAETQEDQVSPGFEDSLQSSKSGGKPLPKETQESMGTAFGADLIGVKVHTGKEAQGMSKEIHAQAFTHGNHIYFNEGKYQPETSEGKELLAHELTHTIQQGATIKKQPDIQKEEAEYDGAKEIEESEREAKIATDPLLAQLAEERAEQEGEAAQQEAEAAAPQVEPQPPPPPKESPNKEARVAKPKHKAPDKMEAKPEEGAEPLGDVGQTMEEESANVCDDGAADAQQLANNQQAHDSASEKQQQSEASVESPQEEGQSRANAEQVANLDETEEPQIDPEDNSRALESTIEDHAPSDIEELNEFKPKEQAKVMGNEVLAETSKQVGEVQGTYNEIENDVPAHENPTSEPLPPIEEAPNTPTLNMGEGAVPDVKEEQVDISEYESNADAEFEKEVPNKDLQAEIEKVSDGEIGEANQERANISEKVATEPASIMDFATERQQNVQDEMLLEEDQAKTSMEQKRQEDLDAANAKQNEVKSAREQKKDEIIAKIEEIHNKAKEKIDEKLSTLEEDSLKRFDEGQERYAEIFERDANADKRAWQKDRYSGFWGAVTWVADRFRKVGEFPEVKAFFDRRRNEFISNIDFLISEINRDNEKTIEECKQILADSRVEIDNMIAEELPHSEGLAAEMREYGADKLAELDNHIEEQKQKLQEALCDKKKQAIEDIDKKIEEMKADMNGFFANLLSLLADIAIKFFEWALEKLGINPQEIMDVINKGKAVLMTIVSDPIQFFKNLAESVKTGLNNFVDNIWEHLLNGMISWLTGAMGDIQIKLPQKWDFMGILDLVLQILGLTWPNIRAIFVEKLGEPVVKAAEEVVKIVLILQDEGLIGVWNYIKEFIMNKVEELKNKVFDMIIEFITIEVVKKGVTELLLMLNPAGAILKAIMSIYRLIMFLVNNLKRIMAFVKSVIDTIEPIANGAIDQAAKFVEGALAKTVPIVLAFVARMIGLGGIGKDIQNIIQRVRGFVLGLVEKGVDWIINFAKDIFNSLLGRGGDGDEEGEEDEEGEDEEELDDSEVGEVVHFNVEGESHKIWIADEGLGLEVMVASMEMTVEDQLNEWKGRIDDLAEDKQGEAQSLIAQASSQNAIVQTEAQEAKVEIEEAKTEATNEEVQEAEQADNEVESAERTLKNYMEDLFELFEGGIPFKQLIEEVSMDGGNENLKIIVDSNLNDKLNIQVEGKWLAELLQDILEGPIGEANNRDGFNAVISTGEKITPILNKVNEIQINDEKITKTDKDSLEQYVASIGSEISRLGSILKIGNLKRATEKEKVDLHSIKFTPGLKNNPAMQEEYTRQLGLQQTGINNLTLDQWILNRDAYTLTDDEFENLDQSQRETLLTELNSRAVKAKEALSKGGRRYDEASQTIDEAIQNDTLPDFNKLKAVTGRFSNEDKWRKEHIVGIRALQKELRNQGEDYDNLFSRVAVLHNSDQIAGGFGMIPIELEKFKTIPSPPEKGGDINTWEEYLNALRDFVGSSSVNSSIGAGWKTRIQPLHDKIINDYSSQSWGIWEMNVDLEVEFQD